MHGHVSAVPDASDFIASLSPTQLAALNVPPPGDPYWERPEALKLLAERYPKLDVGPYVAAATAGIQKHKL